MDAAQMRNLMEHYRNLKGGVEGCKEKIQRIRSWTFEDYIDAKTHWSTLGESRLNSGKPADPTEALGMYGRKQFEQERDYELRGEQRRMAVKQALLWQLDRLIEKLDGKEKEMIIRRYVSGERIEEVSKGMDISRTTAFRRLEAGLQHMAEMYRELFEQAA